MVCRGERFLVGWAHAQFKVRSSKSLRSHIWFLRLSVLLGWEFGLQIFLLARFRRIHRSRTGKSLFFGRRAAGWRIGLLSKRSDVFSSHNAKVKEDTGYVNPAKSNKREWPRNHCPLMPSSKVTFFAVERWGSGLAPAGPNTWWWWMHLERLTSHSLCNVRPN
jgi:hypothetical protein